MHRSIRVLATACALAAAALIIGAPAASAHAQRQAGPIHMEIGFGTEPAYVEVGGDGTPGDYRAWFIPSQPGPYTFHFTGSVRGTKIDESLTSGPTTFDEVQDPGEA